MKTNILICGATGFIGRNTAEHFAENGMYQVTGTFYRSKPYSHPKIKMIQADLRKPEDVLRVLENQEIVIQAAATTSGSKDIKSHPYIHVTDNAIINSLMFRQAYELKVKHFIFPSCSIMYTPSEIPLKELDFNGNILPVYFGSGWTKIYLEKMCEFFSGLGQTKFTAFRHSNVFGPYDKYDLEKSHVFGATITKVMTAAEGSSITVWGTGEEKRDLLYVSDVVSFIEKAIENQSKPFSLVNVGKGKAVSVGDLVTRIIALSGKKLGIDYDHTKPSIRTSLCLDSTLAQTEFGWQPKVDLDQGILKTIEWYKENILGGSYP